jgi:predicted Zn finger-like uncharacterized protein
MILSCPDCSARFAIDPEKLEPDGRRVKCGKCAHVWYESPPEIVEDEPAPEPVAVTPLEPDEQSPIRPRNLPTVHQARSGGRGARNAWIAVAVLLVAIGAALWFGRAPIATVYPAAEDLYAKVGIAVFPPPGEGLEIEFNARAESDELSLRGEVVNVSDSVRDVPTLHVVISDSSGTTLKTWSFAPDTKRLGPGERVAFTTETREIPGGAANVSILFTDPNENS